MPGLSTWSRVLLDVSIGLLWLLVFVGGIVVVTSPVVALWRLLFAKNSSRPGYWGTFFETVGEWCVYGLPCVALLWLLIQVRRKLEANDRGEGGTHH